MNSYHNNKLTSYWDNLPGNTKNNNEKLLDRVARYFLTAIRLVGRVLSDAGIELFYLMIFWFVVTKMSQGRDLIVSLFEPDGIYQLSRVELTILSVVSFSLSMWIIPAFVFQQRDNHNADTQGYTSIFERHLFFIHRLLPLIPFWLLAFVLFNGKYNWIWFTGFSIIEVCVLFIISNKLKTKYYDRSIAISGLLVFIAVMVFAFLFGRTYFEAKVAFALVLYLLSFLMYFFYREFDRRIIEQHARGDTASSSFSKYKSNSLLYLALLILHIVLIFILFLYHAVSEFAPESILLYIFSLNIFFLDLFVYLINVNSRRRFVTIVIAALIVIVYVLNDSVNLNLRHYTVDEISDSAGWSNVERATFEARYKMLKEDIDKVPDTVPYPIILVAGEGGGSRAGIWFSENMINFDYYTRGKFRKHIFSISTVSGSSVGLSTVFAFWQQNGAAADVDSGWLELPSKVYRNNFVGSSISGFLFTDLWKTLLPLSMSLKDRNSQLQNEEAHYTQLACDEISGIKNADAILEKNFMSFFYDKDKNGLSLKADRPLVFINTCRSNDGRRGIFSPVKLSNDYFNDAIDIIGYLYEDSVCDYSGRKISSSVKKSISFQQACNTSELFPFFSASAYIDSLGNFVDGGYHENSGLKTTLDVYRKLKKMLSNDSPLCRPYVVYIVYLKNSPSQKNLYEFRESEIPLISPLNAFANQPFQGSASYFEEQARFISAIDEKVKFIEVGLDHQWVIDKDSVKGNSGPSKIDKQILADLRTSADTVDGKMALNFPLARWLSMSIIRRIRTNASLYDNRNDSLTVLLDNIIKINKVQAASLEPFKIISNNIDKKMVSVK